MSIRHSKVSQFEHIPLGPPPFQHPTRADSPPASAYFSPDGHPVDEESVGAHFSFSTTLRKHKRKQTWRERASDVVSVGTLRRAVAWIRSGVMSAVKKDGYESLVMGDEESELKDERSASARFCTMTAESTLFHLSASATLGLSHSIVPSLQQKYGYNEFSVPPTASHLQKFFAQITEQPLIILLLLSALVSALVGNYDDAISIIVAVNIVLVVAYVQERRSEKSLEMLGALVPHSANVIRSSPLTASSSIPTPTQILANELVPGDLITFATGDRIPADTRLLEAVSLEIDESSLTGENKPKSKNVSALVTPSGINGAQLEVELADRTNIAYMGTLVRSGHGKGVVVATGSRSEFGKVFEVVQATATPRTPLQTQMDALAHKLSVISFGVIGFIVLVGVWQGKPILDMFTVGVSLAVAAIPEGLPIVTTVTLALGVLRMSRKKSIVKRLHSVEALGGLGVIGVDKTGTLTMNEMRTVEIWTPASGRVGVPLDEETENLRLLADTPRKCLEAAVLANNATASNTVSGEWVGQSTDVALMKAGVAFGVSSVASSSFFQRTFEKPFSSEEKWMWVSGTWVHSEVLESSTSRAPSPTAKGKERESGRLCYYAKGAPEKILSLCGSYISSHDDKEKPLDDAWKREVERSVDAMSARGLRVVASASTSTLSANGNANATSSPPDPKNLTFLGLLALHDPPRPGVHLAIKQLQTSGVRVVMITGDSEGTACAIAREVGILPQLRGPGGARKGECVTGKEIDSLGREELSALLGWSAKSDDGADVEGRGRGARVFARTTPKHKMRIVEAFKDVGAVVGMTGDGVNDAPALKRADIGISMGGKMATDVAKEAADVILVNDEFGTILAAIEEGKSIFHNIQNFLSFQLSTAVAALSLITLSTVFHLANPLNAMQILFINILMDGPPSQSLGVDPVDPSVMLRPPRRKDEPIITKRLLARVIFSASTIIFGTLYVYVYALSDAGMNHRDQTMTFTTFVFLDLVSALQNRSLHCGLLQNKMLITTILISFFTQLAFIYFPLMQSIFQTESLSSLDLGTVGVLAGISWCLHELRRTWERRLEQNELIAIGVGQRGVEGLA